MLKSCLLTRKAEQISAIFWLFLCLIALFGFSKLRLDADYSAYFSKGDPLYNAFKQYQSEFFKQDELILLLEAAPGITFPLGDNTFSQLKSGLLKLSAIEEVNGYSPDASSSRLPLSYKTKPSHMGFLSSDAQAVLVAVSFKPNAIKGTKALLASVLSVKDYIDELDINRTQPFHVYYSGPLALNWQYAAVLKHDLSWFIPSLALTFSLMLLLVIRERMWLFGIGVSSLITLVLTVGLAGWGGFTLAAISGFIPVVVVSLSVAYAVHLYFGWRNAIDQGESEPEALAYSLRVNIQPLFWGALTTAMGFSLLALSPSPPIQDFGKLVAFAVMVNFLVNLTVLLPFAKRASVVTVSLKVQTRFFAAIDQICWRYKRSVLGGGLLISLLAIYSVSGLKFDDDALNYFPEFNLFNQSKLKMEQHFNGVNQLYYVVDSAANSLGEQGVAQRDYVSKINLFSRFLRLQDEVLKVSSIVDWIRLYGIGPSRLNLLLNDASVMDSKVKHLINQDGNASVVTVDLIPMTAAELIAFEAKVADWNRQNVSEVSIEQGLSQGLIFAHLSLSNARTMLASFAAALLFLLLIVSLLKTSFKLGLLALAMNLLPLIWVFGLWQWLGGSLSLGSAVVMGMMLGIIIDDSLHLLLKVNDKASDKLNVISRTLTSVMPAVAFTSLLLFFGFALGLSSDFFPIVELSFLSMLIVALAFMFDLLWLPILYKLIIGGWYE
ncbi:MMPL family transporter [Shewanella sp. D64]|uniref:efflux RND transporter permease subunit n=1 Tax=unclassified Shewanella TaxID=196818 RepID=UPI0022BA1B55|nr:MULTISPECIES: MMPL family transporter [unclassified Shewanella]MEC4726948.1 MMPL family transporter [Shewanella sp. D64]MEC4738555.1 MMPL family transporter [Shewanella sp. E94]WBJ93773.1 MMPL family transporter [Shewanella sp. MTB7]